MSLASEYERFDPYYTFENGNPPRQFKNRVSGLQTNLLVGHRLPRDARWSWGWQGTVGLNDLEWSLSIPAEPAEIRYSMPYRIVGSVVPEVRIARLLSVFANAGAGVVRIRQTKTAPFTSNYDFDALRPVWAYGGGVRIIAGPRTDVLVEFSDVRSPAIDFDTFTHTGVRVEHFKDTPRSIGVSFGAAFRF